MYFDETTKQWKEGTQPVAKPTPTPIPAKPSGGLIIKEPTPPKQYYYKPSQGVWVETNPGHEQELARQGFVQVSQERYETERFKPEVTTTGAVKIGGGTVVEPTLAETIKSNIETGFPEQGVAAKTMPSQVKVERIPSGQVKGVNFFYGQQQELKAGQFKEVISDGKVTGYEIITQNGQGYSVPKEKWQSFLKEKNITIVPQGQPLEQFNQPIIPTNTFTSTTTVRTTTPLTEEQRLQQISPLSFRAYQNIEKMLPDSDIASEFAKGGAKMTVFMGLQIPETFFRIPIWVPKIAKEVYEYGKYGSENPIQQTMSGVTKLVEKQIDFMTEKPIQYGVGLGMGLIISYGASQFVSESIIKKSVESNSIISSKTKSYVDIITEPKNMKTLSREIDVGYVKVGEENYPFIFKGTHNIEPITDIDSLDLPLVGRVDAQVNNIMESTGLKTGSVLMKGKYIPAFGIDTLVSIPTEEGGSMGINIPIVGVGTEQTSFIPLSRYSLSGLPNVFGLGGREWKFSYTSPLSISESSKPVIIGTPKMVSSDKIISNLMDEIEMTQIKSMSGTGSISFGKNIGFDENIAYIRYTSPVMGSSGGIGNLEFTQPFVGGGGAEITQATLDFYKAIGKSWQLPTYPQPRLMIPVNPLFGKPTKMQETTYIHSDVSNILNEIGGKQVQVQQQAQQQVQGLKQINIQAQIQQQTHQQMQSIQQSQSQIQQQSQVQQQMQFQVQTQVQIQQQVQQQMQGLKQVIQTATQTVNPTVTVKVPFPYFPFDNKPKAIFKPRINYPKFKFRIRSPKRQPSKFLPTSSLFNIEKTVKRIGKFSFPRGRIAERSFWKGFESKGVFMEFPTAQQFSKIQSRLLKKIKSKR